MELFDGAGMPKNDINIPRTNQWFHDDLNGFLRDLKSRDDDQPEPIL